MKTDEPSHGNRGTEQAYRLAWLVMGFVNQKLTASEHIELDDWVTASEENQRIFERLIEETKLRQGLEQIREFEQKADVQRVKQKNSEAGDAQKTKSIGSWWLYAAAAAMVIAVAIIFLFTNNKPAKTTIMAEAKLIDIAPGKNIATLTLADGTVIGLDSVRNGKIAVQRNTNITKSDSGELSYQLVDPTVLPQAEIYNELRIPAGGQYRIVLPDGTKVWLNAASSLRYPTVFGGAKRKVELTGEAYFEVAKDPMYPFEVTANGSTVRVLGTHFNVNAYTDEPVVKVALAEGSIKLNSALILKPGEEGKVFRNKNVEKGAADLEVALAWKNGQFVFKQTPIEELMRQVGRWYNAGIIYDTKVTGHFNAEIPRDVPVSKLLHFLETTGSVHFKIENKTITVMK